MEKLLNFKEPIDVTLLDGVVEAIYGPNAQAVSFPLVYIFFAILFLGGGVVFVYIISCSIMVIVLK
jgi:hypothetical protein